MVLLGKDCSHEVKKARKMEVWWGWLKRRALLASEFSVGSSYSQYQIRTASATWELNFPEAFSKLASKLTRWPWPAGCRAEGLLLRVEGSERTGTSSAVPYTPGMSLQWRLNHPPVAQEGAGPLLSFGQFSHTEVQRQEAGGGI